MKWGYFSFHLLLRTWFFSYIRIAALGQSVSHKPTQANANPHTVINARSKLPARCSSDATVTAMMTIAARYAKNVFKSFIYDSFHWVVDVCEIKVLWPE